MRLTTPEELFSKFVIYKKFYTPFNWNVKQPYACFKIKNISTNKFYIRKESLFETICNKYPYNLEDLIHGFYFFNDNFYDLDVSKISKYILYWNKIKRSSKVILSEDILKIKNDIIKIKDNIELINFINKYENISFISKGYLLYYYKPLYNYIIEESKNEIKSIEKELILKDIFKMIQRTKIIFNYK